MAGPLIPPGNNTTYQGVGNIMESIAMEEKSIANILQAESAKLNTVLAQPNVTPQQLLDTNKSVQETVDALILMEGVLQSKLKLFQSIICQ